MGFWKIIGKAERKGRVGLYYLYIERVVEADTRLIAGSWDRNHNMSFSSSGMQSCAGAKALPMSQGTTWNVANESCRSRVETRETRWLFPVSRRHALPTNNFHQIEISYRNLSSILPSSLLFLSRLSRDKRLSKEILYWEEVLKTNINPRSLRKNWSQDFVLNCFKFVLRIITFRFSREDLIE